MRRRETSRGWVAGTLLFVLLAVFRPGTPACARTVSTWPGDYAVQRDDASHLLTLSTPYYTVQHDLRRGGAIASIRLTHGRATNLLVQPIAARIQDERGVAFSDLTDAAARVTHRIEGSKPIVTVETTLRSDTGTSVGLQMKTVFEYRWGYIKIRREFTGQTDSRKVREVCPFFAVLTPSLSEYGYREGKTEQEGAPPFAFGSNRWGKLRRGQPTDQPVKTPFIPRSMLFADAGVEGLEWFAGSDLSQWDLQLTGSRGHGQCLLEVSQERHGLALSLSPLHRTDDAVSLPKTVVYDFYLGLPLLEGHAMAPWLHNSFNRNRGAWVSIPEIRRWAENGLRTVHCHNDGDYYDDGLFWRDGSYPPYPDMEMFDHVISHFHEAGFRVATYFSNKELHPSTKEFQTRGPAWARMNLKGQLQHNLYRGTSEFGAQMCLRSGWLDFLKLSIDRVLKHHRLDGVYYDWNVALHCCNPLHEGKRAGEAAAGHWDIDALLDLMEWTRHRVGPGGLVIVHNTTTPMFCMENFADFVVANEWGYGSWKDQGPTLDQLPLEWSLVGARARGVISYGQLNAQSPQHLHRVFALQALLSGVTPWPASPEAVEFCSLLRPLGDIEAYRFADWRNSAVTLDAPRCASAIYSRPGESHVLLANLQTQPQEVRCRIHPANLPHPLPTLTAATLSGNEGEADPKVATTVKIDLNVKELAGEGVKVTLPAEGAMRLHLR